MNKFTLTFHHSLFKLTLVLVTFRPAVGSLAIHFIILKLALVSGPVTVDSKALPVLFIQLPPAFIFCKNAVTVPLAVIDLKSIPVPYLIVAFCQLRGI